MYDDERGDYVALSISTPIVRYLDVGQPIEPLTVTSPLRILGMVASPQGLGDLDIPYEKQRAVVTLDAGYRDASALLEEAKRQDEVEQLYHRCASIACVARVAAGSGHLRPHQGTRSESMDWDGLLESAHELLRAQQEEAVRQQQLAGLFAEGQRALRAGNWDEAIERLEAVVRVDPSYNSAAILLEGARRQQVRERELAERYRQAQQALRAQSWAKAIDRLEAVSVLDASTEMSPLCWTRRGESCKSFKRSKR